MWDLDLERVVDWLAHLDTASRDQVVAALELLEEHGPQLGRPLADSVKSSRHKNMKELRPGSSGLSELRLLFAFDPERRAIVLLAGDKSGEWKSWYDKNVPIADNLFDTHLADLKHRQKQSPTPPARRPHRKEK